MSSSKELVVSQSRHETKVAILEDGQLVEVYFQRANEYSLAGSIHKGRVTRVLPGMQSAFVDLGLERDCFLYVSDFWEEHGEDVERVGDGRREAPREAPREGQREGRRGGRDRGRDRGQERERPVDAPPELPRIALPLEGAYAEPLYIEPPEEAAEPAEATVAEAMVAPDAAGQAPVEDNRNRDRDRDRGRRSRRRRRGSGGFPDAKYAGPGGPVEAAPVTASVEPAAVVPVVTAPVPEPAPVEEDIFVLPGESLAKYRRKAQAPVAPMAAPIASPAPPPLPAPIAAEPEEAEDEVEEFVIEPSETMTADDAAEEVLDRIEEMEEEEAGGYTEEPEAESEVETETDAEVEAEADADSESETEEEAEGEAEGEAETESGAEAAEGEAGEGAAEPESLTATVRTQGDRLPRRLSRRRRRRGGRPGPGEMPEAVRAVAGETVEPVRPVPVERSEDRDRGRKPDVDRPRTPLPSITDLLKEGQEIIVQIAKEPLGQKGARITSHIALPGRYVVYMPTVDHLGVSRRISTDDERQRLKRILQKHIEGMPGGFIMRTAGEGKTEEDIASDMQYLGNLWLDIRQKAEKRRAPALLHHDVEVVQRLLRDHLNEGFKAIWVDSEELYENVLHSVERLQPALLARVKMYTRPEPIFDAFGITAELEKALRPKVWLKSGGYIVINQTEALVAIDVNTGKYVGKSNRLEDTIVRTNLEAVKEISRQVRLRDLGGIIVVDFIDMDERKNRQKVMQGLEEAMRSDKAPYKILQFNDFGLVAITRKRVKQSLERTLCAPCPYCEGAGYVKSVPTVISEILVQAQKYAKVADTKEMVLRVSPEVAKELKSVETKYLEEVEEVLGRPVLVTSDERLHMEKFDLT